jgi:DNA-directed RNA polymerase specialized sigma24 family protein
MAGGTPQTLWTAVIQPAAQGSSEHMGSLFRTYQPSVTALMRQHRPGLAQGDVEDLYHEFVRVCLHRDFLANVDRAKGRFRHFLWTCVRRFLQDVHERHQRRPEAHVDGQVENGVGDEPGIEIPHPEDAGWMAMDEAWARQVEAIALKAVAIEMHDARRPGAVRECVLARLKGIAKGTLKEDAQLLGIDEASFNNVFYAARNSYRRFLRMELSRQVAAEDLNDELEHLARVLARVRSMERD